MTTGGALVMIIGLIVAAVGWFAAVFTHHQVVVHKRRLAMEAAKGEDVNK